VADNPPPPSEAPRPWKLTSPGSGARRGLGRGLGALIPGADLSAEVGVVEIPVDRIKPNARQPRAGFNEQPLAELEASIREHGVLQPVLVRPSPGAPSTYELVAGERRWRAASAAGLRTVPAVVKAMDDRSALEAALVENLQREDLNPMERARAYRGLVEDFGLTQDTIARRVGRSQSSVANTIRLLALPGEVQASLEAGRITEGHARALLGIEDIGRLVEVWRHTETKGLSVRAVEALARRASISREMRARKSRKSPKDNYIIQQKLSDWLGSPVRVTSRRDGGGEIRITFFSLDDLDRLIERLEGPRRAGHERS
jgi:ParB family chromosome partitioning protein